MAHVRRRPYSKPIPADAEVFTRKGRRFARFSIDGKQFSVPLTKRGDRIRLLSRKYYGEYSDADGILRSVPLSTDKTAAEQILAELVRRAERGKAGIADRFEEHRKRPLAEHLGDFEADLRAKGVGAKHVRGTVACVRRILADCGAVFIADLSASRVQGCVAELRAEPGPAGPLDPAKKDYSKTELVRLLGAKPAAISAAIKRHRLEAVGNGKARRYPRRTAEALLALRSRGRSIKTGNLYLAAVKQFTRWLVKDRRMAEDPLAHLAGGNVQVDRRHDRRPLDLQELRTVILTARRSDRSFRGLTGPDRAMLYAVACASGFRAGELASLYPRHFDLTKKVPVVNLAAGEAKNRRAAVQPLPPDLAVALGDYLADLPADSPVWPGTWPEKAAEMFRLDLEAPASPTWWKGLTARCSRTSTRCGIPTSPCWTGLGPHSKKRCSSPVIPTPS
jgi:hypothetical protein